MLCITIATLWLGAGGVPFQTVTPEPAVTEVRQARDAARKDVDTYAAGGGKAGSADHPAVKWDATLWAFRERYPRTEAAAIGTVEAVRLLVRAELWDRARARVASVPFDDPAWERLPAVVYEEGIARKDLPSAIAALTRAADAAGSATIKASALVTLGRAYRRQGEKDAATRAFEAAKAAAPGTPYAEEADGLIYEIRFLSVGLPAPAVAAKATNGRDISLAALRGKPVVLVFWGTT
jgi:tetratricopeptide (TPR) repeat protein